MNSQEVIVTARWTAKPGKKDGLKALWEAVSVQAKATEPGLRKLECYEVHGSEAVIIHEVFQDGVALGAHLVGTAAEFFPKLLAISDPGPYFFLGNVPDELAQAASGMNMGAIISSRAFGFSRD